MYSSKRRRRFQSLLERLGLLVSAPDEHEYHAFISYSHKDAKVAAALERGLERFAKPWYRLRALRIFRDQDMSAGPLGSSISRALDASEHLILVASEEAATSEWVGTEASLWHQRKPGSTILIALCDGEIIWNEAAGDFDWERTTALPASLRGTFTEEPLWRKLNWRRSSEHLLLSDPEFRDAIAFFAATLHGVPKDEIAGEEVRQQRRTIRIARTAAAFLITLTAVAIVLAVFAFEKRSQAIAAKHTAESRQLASEAMVSFNRNFDLASLLSVEAYRLTPTLDARRAILTALERPIITKLRTGSRIFSGIALSPDGKTLATGGTDLRLWSVATHRKLGPPLGGVGGIDSLAFSPDGKTLATGGADLRLWSVATHRELGTPFRGARLAGSVAFSPDGKTLATASFDKTVRLWSVATHHELGAPLRGHSGQVWSVAFSPDGKTLASGDNTVRLWSVARHQELGALGPSHLVFSVAFSPDGKTLASGGGDGVVRLWSAATHHELGAPLRGHANLVQSVAFSPNGKTLASASHDKTIRLWDLATHRQLEESPLTGDPVGGADVTFGRDSTTLFAASDGIRIWRISRISPLAVPLRGQPPVRGVAFSPDGKTLATGGRDLRLWSVATHRELGAPLGGAIENLAFSPDGKTLATGGTDLRLWSVATHRELGPPVGGVGLIDSLAFSPDGKTLATGGADLHLWSVATHRELGPPFRGARLAGPVAFSPDGKTLATGGAVLRFWSVATHRKLGAQQTGVVGINSVAFSPDGKTLATGGMDSDIRLWRVATGSELGAPLTGHTESVTGVAFSRNATLVSSGADDTLRLWDVPSREEIGPPFKLPPAREHNVAVSRDGVIASLSMSVAVGKPYLWNPVLLSTDGTLIDKVVCGRVQRSLSKAEWANALPQEPYHRTCN